MLANGIQPSPCRHDLSSQWLDLLHGPPNQMLVDAQCDAMQPGAVQRPAAAEKGRVRSRCNGPAMMVGSLPNEWPVEVRHAR